MRSLIVVNPVAGKGRAARIWERVRQVATGLTEVECATTERVGHARELAAAAARSGYERVVAVGGDGTLCEVASGVVHSSTSVAIIPAGTGNDCCRNLGVPSDPLAAAHLALGSPPHAIDLGEITTPLGTSHFVNVAGFGFDAEVAWRVNRAPKFVGGTVPYVMGVMQTLWQFRSIPMRITVDDRVIDQDVFLVAIANGASYAGGMRIAPDAVSDDGLFDVCIVGDISRREVLRLVPKMYSGGHRGHPAVRFFRCREVRAESTAAVRCQADGELVGPLPATFKLHPGGLQFVRGPAVS